MVLLASAGARASARAGWPSTCRGAAVVPAASTADAVREVAPDERAGTRAAIGPRLAARRYGAVMLAEDLEDDPGNATRFAWLAPRRRRAAAARRAGRPRPRSCSGASGSGASGLARLLPGGVRVRRREPHPDRVAPAAPGDGRVHVLPRPRGLDGRSRRCPGRSQGLRTHAEVVRVLGSFATTALNMRSGATATLRDRGKRCTPRPTGVRAARRPPAART